MSGSDSRDSSGHSYQYWCYTTESTINEKQFEVSIGDPGFLINVNMQMLKLQVLS